MHPPDRYNLMHPPVQYTPYRPFPPPCPPKNQHPTKQPTHTGSINQLAPAPPSDSHQLHSCKMGFVMYHPATKVAAVRMLIQGHEQSFIRTALGETISRQSFGRWMDLYQQTRCVIRNPDDYEQQGRPSLLSDSDSKFMIQLVKDEPGLFLDEIRERLYDKNGTLLCVETIHQNLVVKLSITLKKPGTINIRKCLIKKFDYIEKMCFIPAEFLVFSDECAICDRDLLRTFARAPKGTPSARFIVNQNTNRISVLPAIGIGGILAMAMTDSTFVGKKWEDFLEWDLLPRMNRYPNRHSILVCDNAQIHKGSRVESICIEAGILIKYLPPYCPELNPIELCFSAFKSKLRRSRILDESNDPEWDICETIDSVITPEVCYKNFRHCGYSVPPS
ncbi:uncharacterized protein PGTG_18554 [Puccinia graminis f. sp. tritici CRL 75-36-700-3]|uniref:Tc1-like transposase DDE domain-containing protein n=1 Tax=Puccinia graminis f. sp. tritici (strain CRL 75-36-700-3 / race SCCL) TaxID=418459 RepID=E3L7N1_PUCGT|nr:uncharacterized protein PGTG_18554 [Puccinia graminis f. sp. tritici CRL 75-36-700-3]EFP92556.1 hypothetical protein PGTG_18554 [Puccinia graminis f. sp. tritici CRL 75-36-700-3]